MRAINRPAALLLAAALLWAWPGAAFACNCPKEAMIKQHGSVSMIPPKPAPTLPLPPTPPGS